MMPHPGPVTGTRVPAAGHTGRYPVGQDGPVTEPGSRRPDRAPGASDDAAGDPDFPWPAAVPDQPTTALPQADGTAARTAGRSRAVPRRQSDRGAPPPTEGAGLPAAAGTRPTGARWTAAGCRSAGVRGRRRLLVRPTGRAGRPRKGWRVPGALRPTGLRPSPLRRRSRLPTAATPSRRPVSRPTGRLPRAAAVSTPPRRRVLRPSRVPRRVSGGPVRRLRLPRRPAVPRRCPPAGPPGAAPDVPRPAVPRRAVRRAAGARARRRPVRLPAATGRRPAGTGPATATGAAWQPPAAVPGADDGHARRSRRAARAGGHRVADPPQADRHPGGRAAQPGADQQAASRCSTGPPPPTAPTGPG